MSRSLQRALALAALFALLSSWMVGWSVVLHLTVGEHHDDWPSEQADAAGLELALNGHAHNEGTPAHGHSFLAGGSLPRPNRSVVLPPATGVQVVFDESSVHRALLAAGPTKAPPLRPETVSILRI